ncbi:MAG: Rrf2 family transcriptional regulator, partial [Bdellovibrionota bacterium]
MNKMNRKVEYALMALKFMSSKEAGQLTSVKEICQSTGAPFDATSRVMQLMAQKKILKAEMGAQGGYQIT